MLSIPTSDSTFYRLLYFLSCWFIKIICIIKNFCVKYWIFHLNLDSSVSKKRTSNQFWWLKKFLFNFCQNIYGLPYNRNLRRTKFLRKMINIFLSFQISSEIIQIYKNLSSWYYCTFHIFYVIIVSLSFLSW